MDILFPWRKQAAPQARAPHQIQGALISGKYHSLPHPQEHAHYYNHNSSHNGINGRPALSHKMNSKRHPHGPQRQSALKASLRSSENSYGSSGGPPSSSGLLRVSMDSKNSSTMAHNVQPRPKNTLRDSQAFGTSFLTIDSAFMYSQQQNDYNESWRSSSFQGPINPPIPAHQQSRHDFPPQSSLPPINEPHLQQVEQDYDSEEEEEGEEEELPLLSSNSSSSPLRQLLDALNLSILPHSLRLSSLAQAVEFFDHRDRSLHDVELTEGAAYVLYQKLGLALNLTNFQDHIHPPPATFEQEIAMICSCLEMVHRANPPAIAHTWNECGAEVLPLLVAVLERPFQRIDAAVKSALHPLKKNGPEVPGSLERAVALAAGSRDSKLAVQKVTKVLAMYSLVPEGKQPMCACPGMLRALTRIIDTHAHNRIKPGAPVVGGTASSLRNSSVAATSVFTPSSEASHNSHISSQRLELAARATSGSGLYMTEAARFNTLAILTNLAALEENRLPMLQEVGLLDNLCRAVHNERSEVPKQCSALALMNLSNGDSDHVPELARNDLLLETLLTLTKEDNSETTRNAFATIFNMACSDPNTVRLARYRDGVILEALMNLVGSDDPFHLNVEARAHAAETLFHMSCSEIFETIDRMANHAGLLECLATTLKLGASTGLDVKMFCSATLRRMAEVIRYPMVAQGALLSALVKASTWTKTDCIAEAYRAQASVSENCAILAQHHGLLNALSRMALLRGAGPEGEKVRVVAVATIELMSREEGARPYLASNEGIMMALTKASFGEDASLRGSRKSELFKSDPSLSESDLDDSRRTTESNHESEESLESSIIQVALKNVVSAM